MAFLPTSILPSRSTIHRSITPRRRPIRSSALPLPDDTAVDMLTFALSGPAFIATGALAFSGLAFLFAFAEIGPRKTQISNHFLRLTIPQPCRVELPDGSVRSLREGETVLRLPSLEACFTIGKSLSAKDGAVTYSVYKLDNSTMRLVSSHPKLIDAPGATWPRDVVQKADSNDLQARWEEYQQLGTGGDIDNEWRRLLDRLSPISFSTPQDECRLCGGTGKVRCFRCGGVGSTMSGPGRFQCDCEGGRRECEWCAMS